MELAGVYKCPRCDKIIGKIVYSDSSDELERYFHSGLSRMTVSGVDQYKWGTDNTCIGYRKFILNKACPACGVKIINKGIVRDRYVTLIRYLSRYIRMKVQESGSLDSEYEGDMFLLRNETFYKDWAFLRSYRKTENRSSGALGIYKSIKSILVVNELARRCDYGSLIVTGIQNLGKLFVAVDPSKMYRTIPSAVHVGVEAYSGLREKVSLDEVEDISRSFINTIKEKEVDEVPMAPWFLIDLKDRFNVNGAEIKREPSGYRGLDIFSINGRCSCYIPNTDLWDKEFRSAMLGNGSCMGNRCTYNYHRPKSPFSEDDSCIRCDGDSSEDFTLLNKRYLADINHRRCDECEAYSSYIRDDVLNTEIHEDMEIRYISDRVSMGERNWSTL